MSRTVYRLVVGGALLLVLVGVNFTVWQRENLLKDGTPVIASLAQDAVFEIGSRVNFDFDPDRVHLFQEQ